MPDVPQYPEQRVLEIIKDWKLTQDPPDGFKAVMQLHPDDVVKLAMSISVIAITNRKGWDFFFGGLSFDQAVMLTGGAKDFADAFEERGYIIHANIFRSIHLKMLLVYKMPEELLKEGFPSDFHFRLPQPELKQADFRAKNILDAVKAMTMTKSDAMWLNQN